MALEGSGVVGASMRRGRFVNREAEVKPGLVRVLRWLLTRRPAAWPEQVENTAAPVWPGSIAPGQVAVTFINHASFLLQTRSLTWLTDPIFAERASPVRWTGPRRVRLPGAPIDDLPDVHVVLVSHNHYDHMDVAALAQLDRRSHPLFLTGKGNRAVLQREGLRRVAELDWDESIRVGEGATVTFTPAQHFSARTLFDRDRTLWGGFHVAVDGVRVYFAGDSGYAGHFRQIRARLGAPDLALLPIGAYEPRWFMRGAHMNPEEAVQAHLDLGAARSIGMHFGTFRLTDEAFDAPVLALGAARAAAGLDPGHFDVLDVGETRLFAAARPPSPASRPL
jgi:L-ascorbate metabolism protein UlaG (beta-lactamase superfamily)